MLQGYSAASQKLCTLFCQFNRTNNIDKVFLQILILKSEIRNNTKIRMLKIQNKCRLLLQFYNFLKFKFLYFEFVSYLIIRISKFPVSDKWIRCNHFEDISFCQFGTQNLWDGAIGSLEEVETTFGYVAGDKCLFSIFVIIECKRF